MKKVLLILGAVFAFIGIGSVFQGGVGTGLILLALGAVMILPFVMQKRKNVAAAIKPGGVGTREEITDDILRICCQEWVVLDTETTGLNHFEDRIIEVAAVKYKNGEPVDQLVSFVNPGMQLPERIKTLTGITDRDLKRAPAFAAIAQKIRNFIGDLPAVAHNAVFDADFIISECARAGVSINIKYIDTVRLAKWCLPPQPDYKLDTLIRSFDLLDHAQDHRALSDVVATENLYMLCREKKAGYIDRNYGPQ